MDTQEHSEPGPPVWLLDVDGVINATGKPGWGAPPRRGYAYADGTGWRMRWAPRLVEGIWKLHEAGAVEVRWCTTWCPYADQLERLFRWPELARAITGDPGDAAAAAERGHLWDQAKRHAAQAVLASGRRLVWTDDESIPARGAELDALLAGGALLITPDGRRGLQPGHLELITAYAAPDQPGRDSS